MEQVKEMSIHKTILKIRSQVGVVSKNGKNEFHKYNYATINDVIREVRDACNENGLLIYPSDSTDFHHNKDGQVESFTMQYTLVASDGSSINVCVRCSGEDKGDKKAYKANTGALKYLFIQVFLLPTEDDPENEKPPQKNVNQKDWLTPDDKKLWPHAIKQLSEGKTTIEEIKQKVKLRPEHEKLLKEQLKTVV